MDDDDDDDDAGDRDTETAPGKTTRTPPPNKAAAEQGGVDDPNISRTSNDQYRVFSEQWNVDAERYALVSLLGSGSYGTVVKAFDKKYEMYVALKRISNALYSKQNAKRTLREIVALNRVSHPNVAELLDVFVKPATTGQEVYRREIRGDEFGRVLILRTRRRGDLYNLKGQLDSEEVRSFDETVGGSVRSTCTRIEFGIEI